MSTDRQIKMLRARRNGYQASPAQLASDIRQVTDARGNGDQLALKSALFDLAATAMAWAEQLVIDEDAEE
jgi:hypothetical protein